MRLRKALTTAGLIMATSIPAKAQLYMCQNCPSGTYSDGTFTSCKNCLTTGVASCDSITGKVISCKGGYKYSNGNCSICPAGTYSNGGGQSSCVACTAGYYSNAGSSSCSSCPTGTWSSSAGATSCLPCTYKPDNATYTSNSTSNSCSWKCNSGYIKVGNKCETCNTSCTAKITEQTAISNGNSAITYSQSCGTSFKLNRPYWASVSVNDKVIGSVSCSQGDGASCTESRRYYICKDKVITID